MARASPRGTTPTDGASSIAGARSQRPQGRQHADFVKRWGANYECMVVLDADSVMSGHALVTLARVMEAQPRIGIMQTLPLPVGRETLFARLMQFGSRLQSPMLSSGLAFWQVARQQLLGPQRHHPHPSLRRVTAQLPSSAGQAAARRGDPQPRLRRGGLHASRGLRGAAAAAAHAAAGKRCRPTSSTSPRATGAGRRATCSTRACMSFSGLHWLSRVHMLTGIVSYVTSPMWLALLLLFIGAERHRGGQAATVLPARLAHTVPALAGDTRRARSAVLLLFTLVVLLVPKVLGAVLAMRHRETAPPVRRRRPRYSWELAIEQLFSMLLAPSMMLFHSTFVLTTLAGRSVSWNAQPRSDRGVTLREAFQRQKWHLVARPGVGRGHGARRAAVLLVDDAGATGADLQHRSHDLHQPHQCRSPTA